MIPKNEAEGDTREEKKETKERTSKVIGEDREMTLTPPNNDPGKPVVSYRRFGTSEQTWPHALTQSKPAELQGLMDRQVEDNQMRRL